MKLGLINSAWVQTGRPTTYGLRKTKEIGFDTVDIFADPLEIDVRQRRLIKDECDRLGLSIVSICSVAVGLIDFEPYLREVADLGIEGALSIELEYSPEPGMIEQWVTEAYVETDRLMRLTGLRGGERT